MDRENTYPPPADGLCVLFLCKTRCSANESTAQASRGALRAIGHCTDCNVLRGSAARLHKDAQCGHERGVGGTLGFIGRKVGKRVFR